MTESQPTATAPLLPNEGEIAHFHFLHLDSAEVVGVHPTLCKHLVYRVHGKARPMLVLRCLPSSEHERRQFLVLPVTRQGLDIDGQLKPGFQPMGKCLNGRTRSYVRYREIHCLPENLISHHPEYPVVKRPADPLAYWQVLKIVVDKTVRDGFAALYQKVNNRHG